MRENLKVSEKCLVGPYNNFMEGYCGRSDLAQGGIGFYGIILMYISTAVSGCDCNVFANVVYK